MAGWLKNLEQGLRPVVFSPQKDVNAAFLQCFRVNHRF